MSLKTHAMTLDEKIRVVELIMRNYRSSAREGNAIAAENYDALRAVAADLQARQRIPKHDSMVEIEVALERVLRSKRGSDYDTGQLMALANTIIRRWPTIAQALEQFQKEKDCG